MKKLQLIFFLLLAGIAGLKAQSYYGLLTLGNYDAGYCDTVIYDSRFTYEAYGYKGSKPAFVQVWHPVVKTGTPVYLSVGDFRMKNLPFPLSEVYSHLNAETDTVILRNCGLIDGEPESTTTNNINCYDLLERYYRAGSQSVRAPMPVESNFPVIVYHHGSQGSAIENLAMAEYFVSRGYIFVSANFHLPYPGKLFGLKPFNLLIQGEDEESLRFILSFARTLSGGPLFFAGHSWGAQMGWRALQNDSLISGFVSLETTLEFQDDMVKIRDYWPEVYHCIVESQPVYPFPVLLMAATGKEEVFRFFEKVESPALRFVSTRESFEHNAYTSEFYFRYLLRDSVLPPDDAGLRDRFILYIRHLEAMEHFFGDIRAGRTLAKKTTQYIIH